MTHWNVQCKYFYGISQPGRSCPEKHIPMAAMVNIIWLMVNIWLLNG